jgi:1-phosphatidylinositol-3-phosphate 5-kinase
VSSGKQRLSLSNPSLPGGMVSPRNASGPSSRIQSPSTTTFGDNVAQASPSTSSNSGLVTGKSMHTQQPAGGEQGLAGDNSGLQQTARSIKIPASTTPKTQEVKRVTTKVSSEIKAPFIGRRDSDIDRTLETSLQEYSETQAVSDLDRTPRPSMRLKAPDEPRHLAASASPRRRKTKDRESSDVVPNLIFPVEPIRPPLVQIGPSHLPGFAVSRETSVDGDYSSTMSGTNPTRRGPPELRNDELSPSSFPNIDQQDPSASLRSKVIAKEFWMRDETAKECFYCGEPFSTFRRKHHCRKLISQIMVQILNFNNIRHLWQHI